MSGWLMVFIGKALTKLGNNLQNISKYLANGTTGSVFHHDQSCCLCSVSIVDTRLTVAIEAGWT